MEKKGRYIFMVNNNWIQGYSKKILSLSNTVDDRTFIPFDGLLFYPLFEKIWIEKFFEAVYKLDELKLKDSDVLKALPLFSSLKFNFFEMVFMLNDAKTDFAKSKKIIDFFLKYLNLISVDQKWYDHSVTKEYIGIENKKEMCAFKKDAAPQVGRIVSGCATLVHGLYNDYCTDYGYDVFGPYDVSGKFGKGAELFIKYFPDLKTDSIWPNRKNFPINKIVVYQVFKNIKAKSFYIGCHMAYRGNMIENAICARVEADGRVIENIKELEKIKDLMLQNSVSHYNKYKKLGFEKQKEIYLLQFCYQFKNFFELVGMNWKPSYEMTEAVKGKDLISKNNPWGVNKKKLKEIFGINYLEKIYGKK